MTQTARRNQRLAWARQQARLNPNPPGYAGSSFNDLLLFWMITDSGPFAGDLSHDDCQQAIDSSGYTDSSGGDYDQSGGFSGSATDTDQGSAVDSGSSSGDSSSSDSGSSYDSGGSYDSGSSGGGDSGGGGGF